MDIRAANKNQIKIVGAINAIVEGTSPSGETLRSYCVIFISEKVFGFYMSLDTMFDLNIISPDFPTIGGASQMSNKNLGAPESLVDGYNAVRAIHSGCTNVRTNVQKGELEGNCNCPKRESVPPRPNSLPFEPIPENNEKMREWLLDRFSTSTFNTCPHSPLPCMTGPPLEIHIDKDAKPKACHTAAPIPLHWQDQVYKDLIRDEALGVIEKVPYGEPVTWCHRMVVTRKQRES